MTIRLSKVIGDLNVGTVTVIEFLQKRGYTIEADPNTKITGEQYTMLVKGFSTDKSFRLKSECFVQERQNKDRGRASVFIDGCDKKESEKTVADDVIKVVIPEDVRPKFKPVEKIDLDKLNRKTEKEPVKEEPKPQPVVATEEKKVAEEVKPVVSEVKKEEVATTPVASELKPVKEEPKPVVVEKPAETEEKVTGEVKEEEPKVVVSPEETEKKEEKPVTEAPTTPVEKGEEGVFKIRPTEFVSKINVIGQINLATLNQPTRPKKKSKEEKRKEREEEGKLHQDQRKQTKEAIIKETRKGDNKQAKTAGRKNLDPNGKKKCNRINNNKEKVDVNNITSNFAHPAPGSEHTNNNRGGDQQGGGEQNGNRNNNNRDRFKKPVVKQEMSEKDVAKQVKETLARLTSKGKNKGAKYHKEKRDLVSNRVQELGGQEMAGNKVLKLTEFVTTNELASMIGVSVNQVVETRISIGMMVSINQRLGAETTNLTIEEFGFRTEYVSAEVVQATVEEENTPEDLEHRALIVIVMGYVDHGKTSLLDYIRKAGVIAGRAEGITQHIGICHVILENERKTTFLDTSGHEVFTAMRARGTKVTDIVIIIVAADDDMMPQTKEAINHAMAAGVPIVFAINKIGKPHASPEKIKEALAQMNYLVEERGGRHQSQGISAKKGPGISELMEKVLLEAEILDLKANPNRNATGLITESTLDKGREYVATVLVFNDTPKVGDIVSAEASYGRAKAMFNERSQHVTQAGPSEPVLIPSSNGAPAAGDTLHVIETDQEARETANKCKQLQREQGLRTQKLLALGEVGRRIAPDSFQELNVIVKGDVNDSIKALSDSLIRLSTEQIQADVIRKAVGRTSESDAILAATSNAIVIGLQMRSSVSARRFAEQEEVDIRLCSVIYAAIEGAKAVMEGMLALEMKEVVTTTIEIRKVSHVIKVGTVTDAAVKEGKAGHSDRARLIRDGVVIFSGSINALKRSKNDVRKVNANFEYGISLVNHNDLKVGGMIETCEEVKVKQIL